MAIELDASDFQRKLNELSARITAAKVKAVREVADEIMRLSSFEVPHDLGLLQASGNVQPSRTPGIDFDVGYNKVYAARLHENPQFHFQKGRKGKYLEDPIKNNLRVFRDHIGRDLKTEFK